MKIRLVLIALLIAASTTTAMAAGPYFGISGDLAIVHDSNVVVAQSTGEGTSISRRSGTLSYDLGGGVNVNLGYDFKPARVEFEFGYKAAGVDTFSLPGAPSSLFDNSMKVLSYMVNGYYDVKTATPLTPYLGAGVGMLDGEIPSLGLNNKDTEFGYQAMVGVGYAATTNLTLDLSYRYQGAVSDFAVNGSRVPYASSNLIAGVRCSF